MQNRTTLSIGQLADAVGLAASTLRYYEQIGLIEPPVRRSGQRRYQPSVLERVALIRICQDSGFTLTEIRGMLASRRRRYVQQLAERKIQELDERIAEAERAKEILKHAVSCPAPNVFTCPNFRAELRRRFKEGSPLR